MADTIFGKILRGEIPAPRVHEDGQCIVIRDINPQAPVHLLVIPRKPIASLNDATEADVAILGHCTRVAAEVARREGFEAGGYRCVWNTGPDGGQEVPHVHMHVLAGRAMKWPPG